MGRRARWLWGTVAVLAGASAGVAGFVPAWLGTAGTGALRDAGFPAAAVLVEAIGLSPDWRSLQLDVRVDSGDLAGTGAGVTDAGLAAPLGGRVRLSGALRVGVSGWAVIVAPPACLTVQADGLTVQGEAVVLPDGAALCAREEAPALRWSVSGVALGAALWAPRLDLPGLAVRLDGLSVAWGQTPQTPAIVMRSIDARADALRRTTTPADIVPLALMAHGEQADGQPWRFTGTASGGQGQLTATLTGSHDPQSGEGRADLRSKPLRLASGGPGLAALSPLLAGRIADASGTLTGKAALVWGPSGVRSSGELRLQGVGGKLGPVTAAGVNGVVALSSLSPPVIPDGQLLAVALLDVGVPLTDGTVRFGYGRDRRLDVDEALWHWAGGTLRTDPFELSPTAPKGTVTLRAEGVDLATILALIDVEGMEATGTLSGTLPVRLDGGRVGLDGGVLEATGAGLLRYDPAHPPSALQGEDGSPGALLLGALTDFRYESLRLTLDGEAGGDLRAGLSVRGANPAFYNGYPVALNLKLSGALDRIVRQSLDAARIPDAVRARMTGFDQKDP